MKTAFIAAVLLFLAPLALAQAPSGKGSGKQGAKAGAAAPAATTAPSPPATPAAPAGKPERLALVIGNGSYKDAPLPNPLNDAADMAKVLQASGFTVIRRDNATLKEMHLAIREFGDKLGRQSTGLFFFAGHALQVRGRNYLLPVDADVQREDEVAFQAFDLGALMEKLDTAKNPVNIVVLDACRNNPFGNRLAPTSKGLATVEAPPGTLIAFATAPGSTASDGGGRNGLYTQYLVKQIGQPGQGIEDVFKAVRAGVRAESKNQQVPWESTSLESAFFFHAPPPAPKPEPVLAAAKPAPSSTPAKRAIPTHAGAPPVFAVGDSWTYRVVNQLDGTERRNNFRVTAMKGDEVQYSNGNISDSVGNGRRLKRGENRVELHTPNAQTYIFPMVPGAAITLKSVQETTVTSEPPKTFDLVTELRIGAEEEVEVPAGKFRAMKVERITKWKVRNGNGEGTNTWTYWYSSAAKRFVLGDQTNVTTAGKTILREHVELVAYDVK